MQAMACGKKQKKGSETMNKAHASKGKNPMLIGGIVAVVAALGLIGGGLYLTLGEDDGETITTGGVVAVGEEDSATACQQLLSSYYSAILGEDATTLYQLMAPPEYWSYYEETYGKTEEEIVETYADAINNTLATWHADCGSDAKVSFQITGSSEQTEELLEQWSESMNSTIGEDVLEATEAMMLEVTQTVTGSDGTQETVTNPVLIKINGDWYILDEGSASDTSDTEDAAS
jgi:hypothetical protein